MSEQDKRTASEKIRDLEQNAGAISQVLDNLARDINRLKDIVKLLDSKVTSIVKASENGDGVSDATISKIMQDSIVQELKDKVTAMKNQGIISKCEVVEDSSFIVCTEVDLNGNETNPRIQFVVAALVPELRTKIVGAKVGDTVILQEGVSGLKVQEVYSVQLPQNAAAEGVSVETVPAETTVTEIAPAVATS